jgi:hypothetical protein
MYNKLGLTIGAANNVKSLMINTLFVPSINPLTKSLWICKLTPDQNGSSSVTVALKAAEAATILGELEPEPFLSVLVTTAVAQRNDGPISSRTRS